MSVQLPQVQELAGLDLLAAHCAALDPEAPTARERLDALLGVELAAKLVFALCSQERREHRESDLRAWVVFAA